MIKPMDTRLEWGFVCDTADWWCYCRLGRILVAFVCLRRRSRASFDEWMAFAGNEANTAAFFFSSSDFVFGMQWPGAARVSLQCQCDSCGL